MIIGLNGLKGSGKDTVGSYMVNKYGFKRGSFAAKLKESAAALFDIDPARWDEWKNDDNMRVMVYRSGQTDILEPDYGNNNMYAKTINVRTFLQRYGTESHRDIFDPEFWVYYATRGIRPSDNVVFTDARFENELDKIKSLGGYNIQIVRPSLFTKDTHASESPPPQHLIDYALDNDGGFDRLYEQVDDMVEWLWHTHEVSYSVAE